MAVTIAQLTDLYLAYFGRPPDFDGLRYYTTRPELTMDKIAAAFSESPESQAMYGSSFGPIQVNAIYQNLFGRAAEPAGVTYWTGEVAAGRITPAGAALAILQGAQNGDKLAVQNKLAVANALIAGFNPNSTENSAFKNFEVFDAKGLAKAFDLDILASHNTVSEIVASGDVGTGASLINMGTAVSYRATASSDHTMVLTEKTGGSLSIMLDADEAKANHAIDTAHIAVEATNATSLNLMFDVSFVDDVANQSVLHVQGDKAASATVVSGGLHSSNVLDYVAGYDPLADAPTAALNLIAVMGSVDLDMTAISTVDGVASSLAKVDASAFTGHLTVELADLKNGGTVVLGSGVDTVIVGATSTGNNYETIANLARGSDRIKVLADVAVAADDLTPDAHGITVQAGVVQMQGAGPSNFDEALAWLGAQVHAGEAVVFQYALDTFLFTGDGIVVKLAGVTSPTELVELGTSNIFTVG